MMATEMNRQNDVLIELNKKHAVVVVSGKTVILNEDFDPNFNRKTVTFSSVPDFKLRYQNRSIQLSENDEISIADFWLSHSDRRQFQGIKFEPYGPNSNAEESEGEFFNLFRGWLVTPRKGNCDLYWNHVHDIICKGKKELYEYVRKWMAQAVQFPQVLPETAIILRGGQGVGKDMFARHFGNLFGQHYLLVFSMDQVAGRFNGHLANVLLLHANEAFWTGKKIY